MRKLLLILLLGLPSAAYAQSAADELLDDPKPAAPVETQSGVDPGTVPGAEPAPQSTPGEEAATDSADPVAEEASDGDAALEAESSPLMDMIDEITHTGALGLMLKGGIFMWVILLLGIIGLGVIIERYRSLSMLSSDSTALRNRVQELLQTDQIEQAVNLCDREEGPVPAILSAGLRKYLVLQTLKHDPAEIRNEVNKSMEDYSVHVVAALERHLPVLATISSVAPMLGFLGTVAGMITSFDTIQAKMGEMNIVEAAAGGISVALLTTCLGLIVGIPAFMAYNYFTSVINRNVLEVEESASELIDSVTMQIVLAGKATA